MRNLQLHCLALVAASVIILSSQVVAEIQFDALANKFLPIEYRNRNFTVGDVKRMFREKCKKASGGVENSTVYQAIEKGATELTTCLAEVVNITAFQEELQAARPIGELDTVFHKYCAKAPEALKCLRDFNVKVQPCLSAKERQQNVVLMRIVSGLSDFMCSHGGDHIALFVAEEGPECLEANRDALNACLNSSFHNSLPQDIKLPELFDLPDLVLEPGHCVDLERFESCTIHHLEQCRETTPANVAESVFKFIKNETSCNELTKPKANERSILMKAGTDGATVNSVSLLSVVLSSAVMLLVSGVIKM